ncbi:ATPase, T2SS/T4P/T4SS family [Nocardia sp. NPDC051030]|uniref:CpaF family protein n=1 Tax=Nocardia sp. NPDC051030 TaxID=3155162 RepID=UPI0034415343
MTSVPPTPPRRSLSSLVHRPNPATVNAMPAASGPKPDLAAVVTPYVVDDDFAAMDYRETAGNYAPSPEAAVAGLDRALHANGNGNGYYVPPNMTAPHRDSNYEASIAAARRGLDRDLVDRLASDVAELLVERQRARAAADPNSSSEFDYNSTENQHAGSEIIATQVRQHIRTVIDAGVLPPEPHEELALSRAIFDHVFGLGVLQPLVDRPDVENILYTGGHVSIMHPDGSDEQVDGVFRNEEEAIRWVRKLADRAPGGGRPFSPANPAMRLNLGGDDIRLSALGWTTNGLALAIRKHLHKDITMHRLVEMDAMPMELADMLISASLAACSTVVSGPMGVGKTTMVRALCAELPAQTRIGTAEMVRELFLHQLPGRGPYVVSAEVITGGGERNELTDTLKGRFDLHSILAEFVSQQLERVIVGEVAGREILALFKAMQMAHGSFTTVHAINARAAIERLATLACEEPGVSWEYAIRQIASHVQLIVQMRTQRTADADGTMRSHRHVSEVVWVEPGENGYPAISTLYRRPSPLAVPQYGTMPEILRERLIPFGFRIADWPSHSLRTEVV